MPTDDDIDGANEPLDGPPAEQIPIPARWEVLIRDINIASARHAWDPSQPRHRIDRFEALILRGEGGFGLVFEVYDPVLDRNVALKLCRVRDDATAEDMLAEARMLARLTHPNVITVHEAGRWQDDVFFVMDFATGKTAHHVGRAEPPWPWEKIVDIYLGAGQGLAAAHDAGIIHGDFKPANVLVNEDGGWPRVADFGLARIRLEHTPKEEREGVRVRARTLGFAAPEVLEGRAADALSDQWSFCAALWRTVEGALPFNAETTDRMLDTIKLMEPWPVRASVPERLRDVLRIGLSENPSERYANMYSLLQALEVVRRAEPPGPVDVDLDDDLRELAPPKRRRKGPGWGLFVAGMLTTGAAVFVATSAGRQPPPTAPPIAPPEPTRPKSACATERDVDESLLDICRQIRGGQFDDANTSWQAIHDRRRAQGDQAALAEDTLIVARTFVEEAERLWQFDPARARIAATRAAFWRAKTTSVLGTKHAGVIEIDERVKQFAEDQSQHSM